MVVKFKIISLNIGEVAALKAGEKAVLSAYHKNPVDKALLTKNGLVGDSHADLKNHGGEEKAVCVFSAHHFSFYREFLKNYSSLPLFGENFSVDFCPEEEVFIGDLFSNGEVILEVSQPRQPCFKTGAYHEHSAVVKIMADSGRTGFYFRVIKEGEVKKGDEFSCVKSDKMFSLFDANDIMYNRESDSARMSSLIAHPKLSKAWKEDLSRRVSR